MDPTNMDPSAMTNGNLDNSNMMDPMEDLFGDAADDMNMNVPATPQNPLPPHLIVRIAEMQRSGCCTTLAWSNAGFIARISEDGRNVWFSAVRRSTETGRWQLCQSSTEPVTAPAHATFVHVQWSSSGIDLALIDSQGVVHYRVLSATLGRMVQASFPDQDVNPADASNVIGMHWLPVYPTEFRAPVVSPSSKRDKHWLTTMSARETSAPKVHHPVDGRSAVMWLNSYMTLTLAYQQVGDGWHKSEASVEPVTNSEDACTHAAFCANAGDLLLATLDQYANLRLYRITVQWNLSQITKPQGTLNIVQPRIDISRLAGAERIGSDHAGGGRLSTLKILPPLSGDAQTVDQPPTVLAVFTHAATVSEVGANQRSTQSVIARWNVETVTPTLHDSFSKLTPNAEPSQTLPSKTILRRQQDIFTPKTILSVDCQNTDSNIALNASDGTINYRERSTFNNVIYSGDSTFVRSLPQAGFEHNQVDHAVAVAPSADGSAVAYLPPDGYMQVQFMTLSFGWQPTFDGLNDPASLVEVAIVCIARQYVVLANQNYSTDEVLALLPADLSQEQKQAFDQHIIQIMNRNPDISTLPFEKQRVLVMKEPLLPRAQSAQLAMHDNLGSGEPQLQAKVVWCLLNLKAACAALACVRQGQEANFTETISSLRGVTRWSLDFMLFVVDSLFAFSRTLDKSISILEAAQRHIEVTGNPALVIVLSSYPRASLKFTLQLIQQYLRSLPPAMQRAGTILDRHELVDIYDYAMKRVPVRWATMDAIVSEIDNAVRTTYQEQQTSDHRRREIELRLLCHAEIAPEFSSVLENLVNTTLPNASEAIDVGGLYFFDTTWLGVHSGPAHTKSGMALDIITKLPIGAGSKQRYCRRCGSVTEALSAEKMNRGISNWLHVAKRHCICGNYWTLP